MPLYFIHAFLSKRAFFQIAVRDWKIVTAENVIIKFLHLYEAQVRLTGSVREVRECSDRNVNLNINNAGSIPGGSIFPSKTCGNR